jgi:sulfonate transport system permease protein
MRRVFTGFFIAFILSFILGIYAGLAAKKQIYYNSIIEFLRHIPPISLIPLLILWFGIGEQSKIIIIVLAAFFPMFLNIKKGIQCCDIKLLEVGDTLGFSKLKKFFKITLPYALPDMLVGMRIGFGYSWRAIIGAEMIAAASGLGYLILDSQQMSRSDKIIIGIMVIGIIGILCDRMLIALMNKILHTKEIKNV